MLNCRLLIFFKINLFQNSFRNTIRVSNSLDPDLADILSGLIWIQTVCNGYQQTTLVGKELILEIFNDSSTVADNQFVLSTFLTHYC